MPDQERLLMTSEAAEIVQLSQAHLEKLRIYGRGPRFVRLGRAIRYRRADLENWIEAGLFGATSAPAARTPAN